MSSTLTGLTIKAIEHLQNTRNGNSRFIASFVMADGVGCTFKTAPDSHSGLQIQTFREGSVVDLTLDGRGRIESIKESS